MEGPKSEQSTPAEFDESSTEASLRRIAETAKDRKETYERMIEARSAAKVAKEEWKKACEHADLVIESEVADMPLFPRPRSKLIDSAEVPDGPGSTWLSAVPGFPFVAVAKLGERGIQTVGELGEFIEKGGKLTDIDGIKDVVAEKAIAALLFSQRRGRRLEP